MKYKLLILLLVFGICAESHAGPEEEDLETGIIFKFDQKWGELQIVEKNFSPDCNRGLSQRLQTFVEKTCERHPGKAIMANLSIKNAAFAPLLQEAGFEMRTTRNFPLQWIVKNGSPIPELFTFTAGAFALPFKQTDDGRLEILICADKHRKNRVTGTHLTWFPGGSANFGEYIRTTAAREVKEEVGLELDIESMKKIYTCERVHTNEQGASDIMTLFVAKVKDAPLTLDAAEIDHAAWINPEIITATKPGDIVTTEDGMPYEVTKLLHDALSFYLSGAENKEGLGVDTMHRDRSTYESFYKV